MSASDDFDGDLTDAALSADVQTCDTDRLREAVLSQTIGVLRFRRRMRGCIMAVLFAGCYLAGLATTAIHAPIGLGTSSPPAVSSALPTRSGPVARESDSRRLTRSEISRRDADRWLQERGDVKEAVRGYDLFLELASADQRALAPEQDSWLLMALKNARSKDLTHDRDRQN